MKDENSDSKHQSQYHFNHLKNIRLGGLVIIVVGVILLLTRIPRTAVYFPDWLFSWPMFLIYFGIFVGALHGFRRDIAWFVLILIGLGFLLYRQHVIEAPLSMYILPVVLIAVGLIIVFRKKSNQIHSYEKWMRKQERWKQVQASYVENRRARFTADSSDFVNIYSTFKSMDKRVLSKNFQGGSINCSFGSCELDLTQADFEQTATINISVTFGSIEIMIPSNWAVQNELENMISSVDDDRVKKPINFEKVLILKGSISFSSVEIRN